MDKNGQCGWNGLEWWRASQTWIPFTQGCFNPCLVEIGSVFLEKKIFWFGQCIFTISYLSPFEKGGAHHLNKLESPSTKDALCQVWLKMVQCFWRRRFLNFINVFSEFRNYLPWKRAGSFIWNNTQGCFVPSLIEIGPVVLEKKMKMWKV